MTVRIHSAEHRQSGSTLAELLVVVAIVGSVVLISIPAFNQIIPQYRIQTTASELASTIQLARQKAVANRAPWRVTFDLDNERFALQRMTQQPTASVPYSTAGNWRAVGRNGQPLAAGAAVQWIPTGGVDLRAGSVKPFKDIDGDGLQEIVFTHQGQVATWPASGQTATLTFTDADGNPELPELVIAVDARYVNYNRYAIRANGIGKTTVVPYKE